MVSVALNRFWLSMLQILCFCMFSTQVGAQNTKLLNARQTDANAPFYSRQQAVVEQNTTYTLNTDFSFTAIAVSVGSSVQMEGAYLVIQQDTLFLHEDEHQEEGAALKQSQLHIFEQPRSSYTLYTAELSGDVYFTLVNAERGKMGARAQLQNFNKATQAAADEACAQPPIVRTSIWREGLPEPSYNRAETSVKHVIVHHSAGSNTSNDYLNTVRNIYLFHTQERGWSDIGYNYLIAQDGTIFQGRSFSDDQRDNDDVRGAHFCGQNSGTMGVCMLGNYNTAVPTDTSVASLSQLISWKLYKDDLDPLASYTHPANSNLGVIAGHRNGCATECPGDNLYAMLDEIRLSVNEKLVLGCQEEEEEEKKPLVFNLYPVPAQGQLTVVLPEEQLPQTFRLINEAGKAFEVDAYFDGEGEAWLVDTNGLASGMYILQVNGQGFEEKQKILLH